MELVAVGERGGERRVVEVPHERRGIEEVDGSDAQAGWGGVGQEISLCDGNIRCGIHLCGQGIGYGLVSIPCMASQL